ncbi:hypothetical protein [Bosea sp. BK604]|uniref:hypothetical protein n=1 Tax=Bosea sp. BK604 TaxID=2512180 RepID=UPI00104B4289|nr:hypothetical protein [Bosea sp. BK604]TCR62628.1 hypothetical protein EV560_110173 [Bosea sp. BK604]
MFDHRFSAPIARTLRRFGGQVAISVAASTAAAGILAFPDLLTSLSGERAATAIQLPATFAEAGLDVVGGKFTQRHGQPGLAAEETPSRGLAMPATLMMPMAVAWNAPPPARQEAVAVAALPARTAQASPATRTSANASRERSHAPAGQPLQIAAVLQAVPIVARAEESRDTTTILGVPLPQSVTRAGRAIGGAVDAVGSAGTWTVSAASSLLPSWGSSAR